MHRERVAIGIRGCLNGKWVNNWQECLDTWAGEMIDLGWRVKINVAHPELDQPYKDVDKFFMCKTTEGKDGVFMKSVYFPSKWLIEQDQYSHVFVTDSDSFIHPRRFSTTLDHLEAMYGELDFVGAVRPVPGISISQDYSIKINLNENEFGQLGKNLYASGGSGFLLSKKAAEAVVKAIDSREYLEYEGFQEEWLYYDDVMLGRIMKHAKIDLIHSNAFQSTSPQINDIRGANPPAMETPNGDFVCVQHYRQGEMHQIMKTLGIGREQGFSVIIPTMWRSEVTMELLSRLQASKYVDEIVIIDNAPEVKPDISQFDKIKYLTVNRNVYVNPAWNWGVKEAKKELICICNDDVLFDVDEAFKYVQEHQDYLGAMGINSQCINQKADRNWVIPGHHISYGWGVILFVRKSRWVNIPGDLKIFYGDNWIAQTIKAHYNLCLKDGVYTDMSTTSSDKRLTGVQQADKINWQKYRK